MTTEQYTVTELDELSGSLLYIGGLSHTLMHVLDVTNDPDVLDLIELVNHAPEGLSIALLSELALALREAIARLGQVDRAVASAIDSCVNRVQENRQEIEAAFDSMMGKVFGDEAKVNGLSLVKDEETD